REHDDAEEDEGHDEPEADGGWIHCALLAMCCRTGSDDGPDDVAIAFGPHDSDAAAARDVLALAHDVDPLVGDGRGAGGPKIGERGALLPDEVGAVGRRGVAAGAAQG